MSEVEILSTDDYTQCLQQEEEDAPSPYTDLSSKRDTKVLLPRGTSLANSQLGAGTTPKL